MSIGIYAIYWETPDLIYIGQSITLQSRFEQHLSLLRNGKHFNHKMQNAFDIYGCPIYFILKEVSADKLDVEEISLISEFESFTSDRGLNLAPGGVSSHGESHPNSIYSNDVIEQVFMLLYPRSMQHKEIASISNVSLDVVKAISSGKLHGWLADKYPLEYEQMLATKKAEHNAGELHSCATVSNNKVLEVFKLLITRDTSLVDISIKTGVSYGIVSLIACGSSHTWLQEQFPEEYALMLSNIGKHPFKFPKITNGEEIVEVTNATIFCRERNLQHPNLSKVFKGTRHSHKGWYLYKE